MSQEKQILEYLQAWNRITPIDALNLFGCFRLGERILELRNKGYNIDNKSKTGSFEVYKLNKVK